MHSKSQETAEGFQWKFLFLGAQCISDQRSVKKTILLATTEGRDKESRENEG